MPDMNYQGEVYGFNNDGSKSLGSSYGAAPFQGAYIRDKQTGILTNLGTLNPGWTGNARDMSEDGNVIVGYDSLMLGREAWVWTSSDGIISLNMRLAALGVAGVPPLGTCVACSDDGSVIVGGGNLTPGYIAELPGHVPFGTGTAGCAGFPVLSASPFPVMNTPVLTFKSTNAPPNSLGLVLITDVPDQFGSDPFGIGVLLHVDLFASTQLITLDAFSDPFGAGGAVANIPNNAALVGQTYFVQILWAWPTSTCFIPPFGLSTTNGLAMTINP
jgi:hypothetical protein